MNNSDVQEEVILYHYCTTETMFNILNKKQLWMTDISRSNDFTELGIFFPDIFYKIEELYSDDVFELSYDKLEGIQALRRLLNVVDRQILNLKNNGFLTSFVICFSELGDSLSQWRGYGNDGKGCALGFSRDELEKYCENRNRNISFTKVKYINHETVDEIIKAQAVSILEYIKNVREEVKDIFRTRELTEELKDGLILLKVKHEFEKCVLNSLQYKWDSFKEEREWRIYFINITKDEKTLYAEESELEQWRKNDIESELLRGKMDFYTKDDCLIPYYPIDLMELSALPIKHVFIGPKNKTYMHDLSLLFAKQKLGKPKVEYSSISYC